MLKVMVNISKNHCQQVNNEIRVILVFGTLDLPVGKLSKLSTLAFFFYEMLLQATAPSMVKRIPIGTVCKAITEVYDIQSALHKGQLNNSIVSAQSLVPPTPGPEHRASNSQHHPRVSSKLKVTLEQTLSVYGRTMCVAL